MEHINEPMYGWFTFPNFYTEMVNRFPNGSTLVELGTYEGKSFSYLIVEALNTGKQFDMVGVDSFTFEGLLDKYHENMRPLQGNFRTIVGQSNESSSFFTNQSVDFVFVDADHVYPNVKADILAWLPKMKPGGIMAGHDYNSQHPGVIQAVDEIFGERKTYLPEEDVWLIEI